MPLNDVRFVTTAGGLGRLPAEKDHVSGIIIALAAKPSGWGVSQLGKKYLSTREAEADGITDGSANFGLLWYFISEFFRNAGATELWVIDATGGGFTAQNVFNLTGGELRQAAWYTATNYAGIVAQVGTIKTFSNALEALQAPCVFITNVKDESTAVDGSAQPDLRAAAAPTVSVLISGDAGGKGFEIADDLSINYVPALGSVLGLMARAKVHENVGWVANFNLASGAEFQDAIFSSGVAYNAIADSVKDTLNTKGYLFLRRHVGVTGTYVNDTHTAEAATSDYAYLENNRTVQKARRLLRTALIPQLLSPLTVDADGKLSADTIKFFENLATRPLERMVSAGELSAQQVIIDPEQDVLTTSTLSIQVNLVPRGVARTIQVTIGFQVSL
jgi:hypothetical protein